MSDPSRPARCDCPPFDCAGRVQKFLGGSREAGDDLIRHLSPLVHGIVQKILGPRRQEEWDDAAQVVWLRVLLRLRTWQGLCPFCQWLGVVAARVAINWIHAPPLPARLPPVELAAPQTPGPDFHVETLTRIQKHVVGWPEERRHLFDWLLEGIPREEMARRLGRNERTVYRLLHAIRQELLQFLPG